MSAQTDVLMFGETKRPCGPGDSPERSLCGFAICSFFYSDVEDRQMRMDERKQVMATMTRPSRPPGPLLFPHLQSLHKVVRHEEKKKHSLHLLSYSHQQDNSERASEGVSERVKSSQVLFV